MAGECRTASDPLVVIALGVAYIALDAALDSAHQELLGAYGVSSLTLLAASQHLLSAVFLAPVMVLVPSYRKRHVRQCIVQWRELLGLAVFSALRIALDAMALAHVELSMGQVIHAALPVVAALLQHAVGDPHPSHSMAVLTLISLGSTLVAYQPSFLPESGSWGVFLAALGVIVQASQACSVASLLPAEVDALPIIFCTAAVSVLASLGPIAVLELQQLKAETPWRLALAPFAGTSLLAAIHNFAMFHAVQRLGIVGVAVLGSAKAALLRLPALLPLLGELRLPLVRCLGCLLALGGAAAYFAPKRPSAGKDGHGSGASPALWGERARIRRVAAASGLPLAFALAALALAEPRPGLGRAECAVGSASGPRAASRGERLARGRGLDPCRNVSVGAAGGRPARASEPGELVLVTGGSGFIGSHLVAQLLDLGYRVRVFDNLETGNLLFLDLAASGLEFHYGDILDADALRAAMAGVKGVFHLGAASKVLPSLKDPGMATFNYERNAVGTSRVLETANETGGVRKVLYAASSTYYGNQPVPFTEDAPFMPTSPYAASKYMGELEMLTHDSLYHLPTLSLRFFMVYGPRNPAHGAYAIVTGKFLARLLEGQPLLIEGSGENYRDFVHVQDVARALILGYQSVVHGTVINIGTGEAYSVKEVADLVSSDQIHVAARKNDLLGTLADTCRAKHLLGFEAWHDFIGTMRQMIVDAQAGRAEYLGEMWADPHVVEAMDRRLPGWSSLASSRERSDSVREALKRDRDFLAGLLTDARASRLRSQ